MHSFKSYQFLCVVEEFLTVRLYRACPNAERPHERVRFVAEFACADECLDAAVILNDAYGHGSDEQFAKATRAELDAFRTGEPLAACA